VVIHWFEDAVCTVCGMKAISHVTVMATHTEVHLRAIAGHFNVCEKNACVLTLREEIDNRLGFLDTEGFAWFSNDGYVLQWNAFSSVSHD